MAKQRAPQVDDLRREDDADAGRGGGDAAAAGAGLGDEADRGRVRLQPQHGEALRRGGRLAPFAGARRGRRRSTGWRTGWRERFRRHRGNADVVRQELVAERGITVSLRTVERAVAPCRRELAAEARATVRFETPPGRQLQIDFGETRVAIGGERVRVYLFVATLGYSRRLLRAGVPARAAVGLVRRASRARSATSAGVPEEVLLDNARALVDAPRRGRPAR